MIPESCGITLLFLFCPGFYFFLHFSFGWGEGAGDTKDFFIVGIFSNYQLKICTEIQLVCLLHF